MRLSSTRIVTGVSCVLFGAAAWHIGPHSTADFTAAAQTPQAVKPAVASSGGQLKPTSGSVSTAKLSTIPDPKPLAAPGSELYTAKRGEAIPTIARRYLGRTSYLDVL